MVTIYKNCFLGRFNIYELELSDKNYKIIEQFRTKKYLLYNILLLGVVRVGGAIVLLQRQSLFHLGLFNHINDFIEEKLKMNTASPDISHK